MTDFSLAVEGAGLKVVKNRLDAHYKTFKKRSKKLQNLVKQVPPRLFSLFFDIR